MGRPENILVCCAHSDDQILGAGGTLAKYAAEGKRVFTYIFSHGEQSHPWLRGEVTAQMRKKEADAADKIIGGHGVRFFDLKEGRFIKDSDEKQFESELRNLIRHSKPDKVFTHSPDDPHPDHRAAYEIVISAAKGMKIEVYSFNVWGPLTLRRRSSPQLYVDVTDTFPTKMKALRSFHSQWTTRLLLTWSIYARAWWAGLHNDCKYAERFVKVM